MGFSVGDWVVCSADKVLGNKPAKERYGRLFRKESKVLYRERREATQVKKRVESRYDFQMIFHLHSVTECYRL